MRAAQRTRRPPRRWKPRWRTSGRNCWVSSASVAATISSHWADIRCSACAWSCACASRWGSTSRPTHCSRRRRSRRSRRMSTQPRSMPSRWTRSRARCATTTWRPSRSSGCGSCRRWAHRPTVDRSMPTTSPARWSCTAISTRRHCGGRSIGWWRAMKACARPSTWWKARCTSGSRRQLSSRWRSTTCRLWRRRRRSRRCGRCSRTKPQRRSTWRAARCCAAVSSVWTRRTTSCC